MFKITAPFTKFALAVMALAIGLAITPITVAKAYGLYVQASTRLDNARLEKIWTHEQTFYLREGNWLAKSSIFLAGVQALIDRANQKGRDTVSVQTALTALSEVIPAVKAAHHPGTAIIASHAGFDDNGNVIEYSTAIATVRSLALVLKDTRTAMNGTGAALRNAIQALRGTQSRPSTRPVQ